MSSSADRNDEPRIATANPISKLLRYLERQSASGFYGRVTVTFQHGKVSDVRTEQTRKLDEL